MALDIELLKTNILEAFDAASDIDIKEYTDEITGDIDIPSFSAAAMGAMASAFAEAINTFVTSAEVEITGASFDNGTLNGNIVVFDDKNENTDGVKYYLSRPTSLSAIDFDTTRWQGEAYVTGDVTISDGKLK